MIFDDKLWVTGGLNESFEYNNEVWFSSDGATWSEVTSIVPFSARGFHGALNFNDNIYIIGGLVVGDGTIDYKKDVWTLD